MKSLFRDASQTEFIIATIPTQLGINESRRLLGTLREEGIPCKRIIVNQVQLVTVPLVAAPLCDLLELGVQLPGMLCDQAHHAQHRRGIPKAAAEG